MSKFNWDKINRDRSKNAQTKSYTDEQWKQVKGTFKSATDSQKDLIRKYCMYPTEMIDNISKTMASSIIEKYIKENWNKKK